MGSTPLHVEQMEQSYLQTLYYVNFCLVKIHFLYYLCHFISIMYV